VSNGEQPRISLSELRSEASALTSEVLEPADPNRPIADLVRLGMRSATSWALGAGLWQIWERIGEELTAPGGDPQQGATLAREAAIDFLEVVGDESAERSYCDRWINGRLGGGAT
jgi:hypothetical protein